MSEEVILSVEDSDADFYFIKMALHDCLPDLNISRAIDGEQAIRIFEAATGTPGNPLPDLVLLDCNLPRLDGFAVLKYLHARNLTARIPVVMFTSSASPLDRTQALQLGARDVVIKPTNLDELVQRLRDVCEAQIGGSSKAKSALPTP